MESSSQDTLSQEGRITGRVKWFNNKAGYGFITIADGSESGSDIFVHHSSVVVSNQQYKYLVQGEYVEFKVVPTTNSTHKVQALDVSGIKNGLLMCESRRESKTSRYPKKDNYTPRSASVRGSGPRKNLQSSSDSVAEVTPQVQDATAPSSATSAESGWTQVASEKKKRTYAPRKKQPQEQAKASV